MTVNLFQQVPTTFIFRSHRFACSCANQAQVQDAGSECELCGGLVPTLAQATAPQTKPFKAVKRFWIMPEAMEDVAQAA